MAQPSYYCVKYIPNCFSNLGGSGVRGSGIRGSGIRGSGVRGSGIRGSGVRDSGIRGSGIRGSGVRDWVYVVLVCVVISESISFLKVFDKDFDDIDSVSNFGNLVDFFILIKSCNINLYKY